MSLLANSNAIESGGYNIDRSLRFRSSASAYLSRTPASNGNLNTWTISLWLKRGSLGVAQCFIGTSYTSLSEILIRFNSNDTLRFEQYTAGGGTLLGVLETTQVFRDPSAWYHIEYVYDSSNATSSDRVRLYINGSRVTAFGTATYPAQNANSIWNNNSNTHYIGRYSTAAFFDGYLAEVNFIDGQALTPSSFGETSTETGVWVPKKYTGTYGTNGFYLNFSDNTSATTLAYDKSGNGNNWTPNNISTTAGATYDSMTDVPTLTSVTAANFAVMNPLLGGVNNAVMTNGNLTATLTATSQVNCHSTIPIPTAGKWYAEVQVVTASSYGVAIGIERQPFNAASGIFASNGIGYYNANGNKYVLGTASSYGSSWYGARTDLIGISVDMDSGSVHFYLNGVDQGAISFTTGDDWFFGGTHGSGSGSHTENWNFGQRPFSYTPPSGFKALNTFNLPDPTIKKPNQYMDATTYTGNGSSVTVSGKFQPDLMWFKRRSGTAQSHRLFDSARGNSTILISDSTNGDNAGWVGDYTPTTDGFTVATGSGLGLVANAETFVGWQWKKGATPGFDIVTYTGTGSATTIAHSLGVVPKMIIVKVRSTTNSWAVYHASIGATNYMLLNSTLVSTASSAIWNNTTPTSSVFSIGTDSIVNASGATYVAYLFSEIPSFSKFGSFSGNGSSDGVFCYLGFKPKYLMVKRTDTVNSWIIEDGTRNPYNVANLNLNANESAAENTNTGFFDFTSNGFKARSTDAGVNASGGTYVYMAFAESPFKTSLAR